MNKAILIGRLARDPEIRQTTSGTAVCKTSIAVDRRGKKDANQPSSDFINITAWGKTAELMGKYLAKGRRVGIEGRIQTGTYQAKDGSKRNTFEVIVENLEFLDSAKGSGQSHRDIGDPLPDEDIPF